MPELAPHIPINRQRTPCADKNDRLGWKDGFSLELEGISFGVRSNDVEMLPQLRSYFPAHARSSDRREVEVLLSLIKGGATARKGVLNYHLVYDAWDRLVRTHDLEVALKVFTQTISSRVATWSHEKLYVLGSVFTWNDQALMLLGGTPELEEDLMSAGAVRFSSEFAQINHANQVESWDAGTRPLAPGWVVVAQNRPGKRLSKTRLSAAATALELVGRTPGARFNPQRVLSRAADFSLNIPGFRAEYGQRKEMVRFLASGLPR